MGVRGVEKLSLMTKEIEAYRVSLFAALDYFYMWQDTPPDREVIDNRPRGGSVYESLQAVWKQALLDLENAIDEAVGQTEDAYWLLEHAREVTMEMYYDKRLDWETASVLIALKS